MPELSPDVKAILSACGIRNPSNSALGLIVSGVAANAIRAAVEAKLPELTEPEWGATTYHHCDIELCEAHMRTRREFLALADELEQEQ